MSIPYFIAHIFNHIVQYICVAMFSEMNQKLRKTDSGYEANTCFSLAGENHNPTPWFSVKSNSGNSLSTDLAVPHLFADYKNRLFNDSTQRNNKFKSLPVSKKQFNETIPTTTIKIDY